MECNTFGRTDPHSLSRMNLVLGSVVMQCHVGLLRLSIPALDCGLRVVVLLVTIPSMCKVHFSCSYINDDPRSGSMHEFITNLDNS